MKLAIKCLFIAAIVAASLFINNCATDTDNGIPLTGAAKQKEQSPAEIAPPVTPVSAPDPPPAEVSPPVAASPEVPASNKVDAEEPEAQTPPPSEDKKEPEPDPDPKPTPEPDPEPVSYEAVIISGKKSDKEIFLTLDDGWDISLTEKAIDLLCKEGVKATLFPVGSALRAKPAVWKKAIGCGMELGNHTAGHQWAENVGEDGYAWAISEWDRIALELLDYRARWFRPPAMSGFTGPSMTRRFLPVVAGTGHDVALWSEGVDTYYDLYRLGKGKTPEEIATYIINGAAPGKIILLHFNAMDVSALPAAVKGLKEKGYVFATLSEGFPR